MERTKNTAKIIVLGGMWKRAFAFLFDLICSIALSCIVYFPGVLPFVVDAESFQANESVINQRKLDSGLYSDFSGTAVDPLAYGTVSKATDFFSTTVYYDGEEQEFYLLTALTLYWTEKATDFGNQNVSFEGFESSIMLIGDDSSPVESIYLEDGIYRARFKEGTEELVAYDFLYKTYDRAMTSLSSDQAIKEANDRINSDAFFAIGMAVPVVFASMAVFFLLVPLCFPNGETFGKKIMKLAVLTDKGYVYPRPKLIWRFLAFFLSEVAGAVATFGATLLISYTMALFTKKHRSLHDYLAGSVVAKSDESLWFLDPAEEEEFNERMAKARKGEENGQEE